MYLLQAIDPSEWSSTNFPGGQIHDSFIHGSFIHNITIWSPNLGMVFLEGHKVLEMNSGFHRYSNKSQQTALILNPFKHFLRLMSIVKE